MKALHKFAIVLVLSLFFVFPILNLHANALSDAPVTEITEWEMKWEENDNSTLQDIISRSDAEEWKPFFYGDDLPTKPEGVQSAWIRFQLPKFELTRPALLISKLTGKDVSIFIEDRLVYESHRNYPYNKNEILLSLNPDESNQMVYILLFTESNWVGLKQKMLLGENQDLSKKYLKNDMLDVVLGVALIIVALSMFLSLFFLNKSYIAGWKALSIFIFSIGFIILAYSPYLHTIYQEFGLVSYYLFDVASNLLMPSIYFFFEKIFGKGPYGLISRFRKTLVVISIINISWLIVSFTPWKIGDLYTKVATISFGGSVVIGNSLLLVLLIKFCLQKNREALILTTGFGIFAAVGVAEITWYFKQNLNYNLFFWKWGIISFIASLVILLARKILQNYEQVVKYSKQLEVFNNELQRSEKMEIISQLAASVAHEVRNPLQVTRGFLQLLRDKTASDKDRGFMVLAIDELDRASEIITDFLTFAKPQLEHTTFLNIREEIQQIEGILIPLATMQGAVIHADLAPDLYVRGNSSKLKQALINIIKNSIEALHKDGAIFIRAYLDDDSKHVVIRIKDNGEGMNEADLKRLGEPYYSKKSKGTGLGLMVTFRIIEVMQGGIEFQSQKGVGTEAIIQFPYVKK